MIVYRHCDPRFPFLWESAEQPPARWHTTGEGPVQYFADTPDGAWAEFLRHEGITTVSEFVNVRRSLWAIELQIDLRNPSDVETSRLPVRVLTGGLSTHASCKKKHGACVAKERPHCAHSPQLCCPGAPAGGGSMVDFRPGKTEVASCSRSSVCHPIWSAGTPLRPGIHGRIC